MADIFFYGTLRHLPLLERVLGRPAAAMDLSEATLDDHAVFWAEGDVVPVIRPVPGQATKGLLARGLTDEDLARLSFFEGGTEYELSPVTVTTGGQAAEARAFLPAPGRWRDGRPWRLRDWLAEYGPVGMREADEIMAWYGRIAPEAIARAFDPIGVRANAWVTAQARPADPARDVARDVVVRGHHRPYFRFFTVEETDLQYRRHDGTLSEVVNRAALMVGEAVVVLPYDPVRDVVLLVEQFRAPVFMAGDRAPWVWEPVAGLVDAGETPLQAAHREAAEEAGLEIRHLEPSGGVYSSTGSSSEYLNLFIGLCDLPDVPEGGGGLPGEGEDIRSRLMPFEALMEGVDAHAFRDMPLVTTALWLARHRDRLRARGL